MPSPVSPPDRHFLAPARLFAPISSRLRPLEDSDYALRDQRSDVPQFAGDAARVKASWPAIMGLVRKINPRIACAVL